MKGMYKVVIIVGLFTLFYVLASSFKTNYTITYKDYDGSELAKEQLNFEGMPTLTPSREGYTFIKWELEFSGENNSVVATAIYEINKYEVVFKDNKGNELSVQVVEHGSDAIPPQIKDKPGHTFLGWDKPYTDVKSDLEIVADFDIEKHMVEFKDEDGNSIGSVTVDYGDAPGTPSIPYKEGYNFAGWSKDLSSVSEDVSVTPIYVKKQYNAIFKDDNGVVISKQSVYHGEDAIAPTIENNIGKTFIGWDKPFSNVKSDLEINALFVYDEFNVVFKNHNNEVISFQKLRYGEPANVPMLDERFGYNFLGWDKDLKFVTCDLEINPLYELKTHKVVFKDDNLNILSIQEIKHGYGAKAPIMEEKEGYEFIGWDSDYSYVTSDLEVIGRYIRINDDENYVSGTSEVTIISDNFCYNLNNFENRYLYNDENIINLGWVTLTSSYSSKDILNETLNHNDRSKGSNRRIVK